MGGVLAEVAAPQRPGDLGGGGAGLREPSVLTWEMDLIVALSFGGWSESPGDATGLCGERSSVSPAWDWLPPAPPCPRRLMQLVAAFQSRAARASWERG